MSATLFDLTYQVARALGVVKEGLATGGTTGTIVDTVRLQSQYADDWWKFGTGWVLYDAAGAGAAPQGEYGRITGFTASSGTVTLETLTVAVAAGDRYALANNRYTLDKIISAINNVLAGLFVKTEDTTTVLTASGQTEYDLPAAILDENIELSIQTRDDTDDNRWTPVRSGWHIAETGTGTAKKLIFHSQPPAGWYIKVVYYTPHAAMYAYNSKLREGTLANRVVYGAALELLYADRANMSQADPALERRIAQLEAQLGRVIRPSERDLVTLADYGVSEWTIDEVR